MIFLQRKSLGRGQIGVNIFKVQINVSN